MKNNRLKIILAGIVFLLLIPFIAMQFTAEVSWTLSDFAIMGMLLLGTGLLCELAIRKTTKVEQRIFLCVAVLLASLLVWAELAVGVFGTPLAGN